MPVVIHVEAFEPLWPSRHRQTWARSLAYEAPISLVEGDGYHEEAATVGRANLYMHYCFLLVMSDYCGLEFPGTASTLQQR